MGSVESCQRFLKFASRKQLRTFRPLSGASTGPLHWRQSDYLSEQATNVVGESLGPRGIPISKDASRDLVSRQWP